MQLKLPVALIVAIAIVVVAFSTGFIIGSPSNADVDDPGNGTQADDGAVETESSDDTDTDEHPPITDDDWEDDDTHTAETRGPSDHGVDVAVRVEDDQGGAWIIWMDASGELDAWGYGCVSPPDELDERLPVTGETIFIEGCTADSVVILAETDGERVRLY